MRGYVIHDLKYGTYYAEGTQTDRYGNIGPRWVAFKYEAKVFASMREAKAAMYMLKSIKNQDNHAIIYEQI